MQLSQIDPELWCQGYRRLVQSFFEPDARFPLPGEEPKRGEILYRGVIYFSTNSETPYVRLKNWKGHLSLPCCFSTSD